MKKNHINNARLFITLILLIFLSGCQYIDFFDIGFDRYFQPDNIGFDFESDKEINFQFEIVVGCSYEIGIGFKSKETGSKMIDHHKIKDFFGVITSTLNLPAKIDITILNKDNEIIFEKNNFGGKDEYHRYGPNPVKFIAGQIYLKPNIYYVKMKVNDRYKTFHDFNAFFFVSQDPKKFCKKQ